MTKTRGPFYRHFYQKKKLNAEHFNWKSFADLLFLMKIVCLSMMQEQAKSGKVSKTLRINAAFVSAPSRRSPRH